MGAGLIVNWEAISTPSKFLTCSQTGPFLYSMVAKVRCHFILDTEVENGKCQTCIIRYTIQIVDICPLCLSLRKSVTLRATRIFPTFPLLQSRKMLQWRMSGTFPLWTDGRRCWDLLLLQDLWESRCLAREWLQIHQKWLAWILWCEFWHLAYVVKFEHFQAFPRLADCSPCICINYRLNNAIKRLREYHAWEFTKPFRLFKVVLHMDASFALPQDKEGLLLPKCNHFMTTDPAIGAEFEDSSLQGPSSWSVSSV